MLAGCGAYNSAGVSNPASTESRIAPSFQDCVFISRIAPPLRAKYMLFVSEISVLQKSLGRQLGKCIADFELISAGDRIMVCLSGGKDSYTMLDLLRYTQRKAPVDFTLVAVHLDQKQPGYDGVPLRTWLEQQDIEHHIVEEDTYSIVKEKVPEGQTYCALCSRLRRGILYDLAEDLGCTKIALGHHGDDAIETLLLNLMFNGCIRAMPAKLFSDDGRNTVIRPLMYCSEAQIAQYAALRAFPILPCNLCGSQDNLMRRHVKQMLTDLEQRIPRLRQSMLAALGNVKHEHLLDRSLLGLAQGVEPAIELSRLPQLLQIQPKAGR